MGQRKLLKECDIIMKGGVTSGVVYPGTVVELAKTYRFRSIGGTSAGAIAAAATAAAEYGRREGTGGFAELEALPGWLGQKGPDGRSNLFNLFRPDGPTRPLFDVLTAPMGRTGPPFRSMLVSALEHAPWAALSGAAPGLLLTVLALINGGGFFPLLSFHAGLLLAGMGGGGGARLPLLPPCRPGAARHLHGPHHGAPDPQLWPVPGADGLARRPHRPLRRD